MYFDPLACGEFFCVVSETIQMEEVTSNCLLCCKNFPENEVLVLKDGMGFRELPDGLKEQLLIEAIRAQCGAAEPA